MELLEKSDFGGKLSLDEVMPQVYDELYRLASAYMHRERQGHTLQPTALVNEAYRGASANTVWTSRTVPTC